MDKAASAVITGGASGLGLATSQALAKRGAHVVVVDLPGSAGQQVARESDGEVDFIAADVTNTVQLEAAFDAAVARGPLRAVVHCAGRGRAMRVLQKDGTATPLEPFEEIVALNLIGSFNVLRLAAARMAQNEPVDGERGVCVLTASIAAFEGQIGQINYAASKAGIIGMTLTAARDLAARCIRVCTIAPGIFDTPLLGRLAIEIREALGKSVPHPHRLGKPEEFAHLAVQIIENAMLNGETIRLDGALRMTPR